MHCFILTFWKLFCVQQRNCANHSKKKQSEFSQTRHWCVENNTFKLTECSRRLSGGADMENGGRKTWQKRPDQDLRGKTRHDTTRTNRGRDRKRERNRQGTMGRGWVRGTPGWGRSTIFLFCVVKLGWIPPARPPFTEPLEEILLLVPGVLRSHSDPFWQLHRTGELHLRRMSTHTKYSHAQTT